mmetsp:Transcript_28148/g.46317  ORF Transcript_28148/g.46317 Transcript_28148/m.46317 type:complete len:237 (-) Transcript_28148:115-825(-)|eukprot:CAMPEP_0202709100 /NCGR_PEP_ID=MMETSP1385-20130828/21233_1 /ASSEMBLY_ACC=CAM_ASM_000861 /TAXON_ID=933848 /ORGANISM="Elphidium margaritaceum" /LENGTH=236 /DNA_ID=CAMNT_0049368261 /DNA_START=51 /DNA_END=761 /DNA_ORIENTATION=-
MSSFISLVVLASLLGTSYVHGASEVVELNEANFEQLTQMNSGQTTGDWFIKFYAPWCGHCKRLAPVWEEVATALKGEVNVAKVDVTQNRALGKQYNIKGFPTLLLFRRGKMVKYSGQRNKEAMIEYAKSATPSDAIPGPLSMSEQAVGSMVKVFEDLVGVLSTKPIPALMLILCGLFIGLLMGAVCCGGDTKIQYKYIPAPSQQNAANGPPPLNATDDGEDDENQEPKDPKTKKDQ